LSERAALLKIDISITCIDDSYVFDTSSVQSNRTLLVRAIHCCNHVTAAQLDTANSQYVINILDEAIEGCQSGKYQAMVTAPVQKSIIHQAGIPFTGHTEYLADKTHTPKVVMMLASTKLKVTLATTHLPLRDVADAITQESLDKIIRIIHHDLKHYFGLDNPKILVCGLNPHAGEDGLLGQEEIEVITPCLNTLRKEGFELIGPLPADTLFTEKVLSQGDAVLAMYHDQGLPVLKYQGFGESANITLGLPIIRTSVDHGTALDLAGLGTANQGSLNTATQMAFFMAGSHNPH
ncbi:MAG: 4-hydroxythreonine-4-phosphate dehydrogenase PdxA, partial [Sinobacterium sp.]|nr:4-hydroxythreonine-4-phosphate dehydrogenase PdxA [Sinobacterium sp.]